MEVVSNRQGQAEAPASERAGQGGAAFRGQRIARAVMLLLIVLVVALVVIWGISSRAKANAQLSQETQELAIPTVAVIHPKPGAPQQEVRPPRRHATFIGRPHLMREPTAT